MTASNFCKDCRHRTKEFLGSDECEVTRRHYVDKVTGRPWSVADTCSYKRGDTATCTNFQPRPTLIQILKEVFQ